MGKRYTIILMVLLALVFGPRPGFCLTQEEEKRLIADVAEIKATLKTFMELTNKRFEDMNKRFEDVSKRFEDINRRFEDVNKRFEDVNKRFDQLINFLWILAGIFTAMTVAVIGFAYWDRRTIIRKARDEAIETIEKEGRLRDLINALRKLSIEDQRLAEVMRSFGLL